MNDETLGDVDLANQDQTAPAKDKVDEKLVEDDADSSSPNDVFDESSQVTETDQVSIDALKPILEGAILAAGEALSIARLQSLFDEDAVPSKECLLEALELIRDESDGRGFELKEVASGWRFQVRDTYAPWVNRLWEEKPQKYSRALLETLALIAYRQPITRGDIEEVRGVAVSSHIIKTLSEREWVKVVGHRDVPGRPSLYATTKTFLDYFNLKSLEELPTLGELKDIDSLNQKLDLQASGDAIEANGMEPTASEPGSDGSVDDEFADELQVGSEVEAQDNGQLANDMSAAESEIEETAADHESNVGDSLATENASPVEQGGNSSIEDDDDSGERHH